MEVKEGVWREVKEGEGERLYQPKLEQREPEFDTHYSNE